MESKLKSERLDSLFEAILSLENLDDCYAFFDDLCPITELLALGQRWEVAKLLDQEMTYVDIAETTGASTATISRVNRCLNYGTGGYRTALERTK